MKILFADDEKNLREVLATQLTRRGHDVVVCADGHAAIAELRQQPFDCLVVDLQMPGCNGIEVVTEAKRLQPDVEAIILTGNETLESAKQAINLHVFAYLTKPYRLRTLEPVLQDVAETIEMRKELRAAQRECVSAQTAQQLLGSSPSMRHVLQLIRKVAPTLSTVLIRGETGTGKELAARAVHDQSGRSRKPFVPVNCGALPETLIESELFGHAKGAFTGADRRRAGLFEVAEGGTLFLDEIGELPRALQAKLLRVLETSEVRRVGENEAFLVDVRIVCATHRDLEAMVEEDHFREDLLFRINMFEITLPPLRQRSEDIPQLALHLLRRFVTVPEQVKAIGSSALQVLQSYSWPGNVRELANVIEHASIVCDQLPIMQDHLPTLGHRAKKFRLNEPLSLRELEAHAIESAIERHQGNKAKAAEELGISLRTLYNRINQAAELDESA